MSDLSGNWAEHSSGEVHWLLPPYDGNPDNHPNPGYPTLCGALSGAREWSALDQWKPRCGTCAGRLNLANEGEPG